MGQRERGGREYEQATLINMIIYDNNLQPSMLLPSLTQFLAHRFTAISTCTFGTSRPVRVYVESSMPRALPEQVATLLLCPTRDSE